MTNKDDYILLDNSRISSFKQCPMNYFIRHELYWTLNNNSPALGFGSAWHAGMAEMFTTLKNRPENSILSKELLINIAKKAFNAEWIAQDMPDMNDNVLMEDIYPRVPGVAHEMYEEFVEQKYIWMIGIKVLAVEEPFLVPLGEIKDKKVFLIGRTDFDFSDSDGIWVGEHKTSSLYSTTYGFQSRFTQAFSRNPQVDTYTYKQKMTYGPDVRGAQVIASLVHKNRHNIFKTIPIYKTDDMLKSWFEDTKFWVELLLKMKCQDKWPHNTNGCVTPYGFCPNKEICDICADPRELADLPGGYKVEKWEPYDESKMLELMKRNEV